MDKQGYERMLSTARSVDASAWAEWGPQERVRFVELRRGGKVAASVILNALNEAGLMAIPGEEVPADRSQPRLEVVGRGENTILLDDLNY